MQYDKELKAITLSQEELKRLTIGQAVSWHILNSRLVDYPIVIDKLQLALWVRENRN